jgi:hypothetical protein
MKKTIRLTESDLVRLVKRVISEQTIQHVSSGRIPCIRQEMINEIYKITDPIIINMLQGKIGSKPVLSQKNYLVYDVTNVSLPEKKYGTITFYSEGNKVGTMNLDGKSVGGELYTIEEVVYHAQPSDQFKIGWVFCNGSLYLYDFVRNNQ